MPRGFELIEDRVFRPLIAVTVFCQIGDHVPDRLKLGDLAVEFGDMREREPFHVFAGAAAIAVEREQFRDLSDTEGAAG